MAKVLVVGLNPAWQKILEFETFEVGDVNRVASQVQLASGKGMNAAKVLARLGHEVHLLQILGGANGERCLAACRTLGLRSLHVSVEEETRLCTTLVDNSRGLATEIIEPFATGARDLESALLSLLPADPGAYQGIALCGTIPQGGPPGIYTSLLARLRPEVSVLDAWQGVDAGLLGQVGVVKVNRKEYQSMPAAEGSGALFLVTHGAADAEMIRRGRTLFRIPVPPLGAVRNPIGAGDTATAGALHFLVEGKAPEEAFRRGLAMGSASCLELEPAEFSMDTYRTLLSRVGPASAG